MPYGIHQTDSPLPVWIEAAALYVWRQPSIAARASTLTAGLY